MLEQVEQLKASISAKVEHPFHVKPPRISWRPVGLSQAGMADSAS